MMMITSNMQLHIINEFSVHVTGACPGIPGIAFQFFRGGGPAQKIAENMIFSTKKVAKYR